jgi:hypothetical protein
MLNMKQDTTMLNDMSMNRAVNFGLRKESMDLEATYNNTPGQANMMAFQDVQQNALIQGFAT